MTVEDDVCLEFKVELISSSPVIAAYIVANRLRTYQRMIFRARVQCLC